MTERERVASGLVALAESLERSGQFESEELRARTRALFERNRATDLSDEAVAQRLGLTLFLRKRGNNDGKNIDNFDQSEPNP